MESELDKILDDYANFKVWESKQDWKEGYDREGNIANSRNIAKSKLAAWRDAAVVEARKAMADNLIDQEAKLYKVCSDNDKICIGIKKMADEVREYYDGGVYEKN